MKIDPAKWQDEDWDFEDDLPTKKLTHREKVVRDSKKASIQKKRREKMRLREEEEKYFVQEMQVDAKNDEGYPDEVEVWEEDLDCFCL